MDLRSQSPIAYWCALLLGPKKINNDYIKYDHYTTSTTTRYNYNPNVLFVGTIRTISFTYSYTLINVTWEMQSFPQKSNSTTDFTRLPHLAAFPCDHTVVISLHGKYFYKTQKIVSYDWQLWLECQPCSLVGFSQAYSTSQQCFSLKKTSTSQPKPAPTPTSEQGGMLLLNVKSNLLLPSH